MDIVVIFTLVISLYFGGEPVSSKWINIPVDSLVTCTTMAESMDMTTIVDEVEDWSGYRYVTTVFCHERRTY